MAALLALALCDAERFNDAERFVQRSRELSAEDDFASQAVTRMWRSCPALAAAPARFV